MSKRKNVLGSAARAIGKAALDVTGIKGPEYIFADRVRRLFKANDDVRDEGLTEPDDVVKIRDVAYGPDPEQVLDVYYPAGTVGALPVIVSVHGGGYVYGDKNLYRFYCMSLAQRGFTVVNFSYRLAPDHRFPDQLMDTNAVMQHLCRRASEYFADTDNGFMVGDSAGAQMASQYSAAVTNPYYAQILELDIPDFRLRACAFNCGFYDPDPGHDRMLMKCYLRDRSVVSTEKMDVFGNITPQFPPSFIMTSNGDFLRDRAEPFAKFLTGKGIENELHIYSPKDRELGHVFHCNMKEPYAKLCNDEECEFFMEHVKLTIV